MALDVYFRRDIANALQSLSCAQQRTVPAAVLEIDDPIVRQAVIEIARQVQQQTLVSVGLAFGLEPVGTTVHQVDGPPVQYITSWTDGADKSWS